MGVGDSKFLCSEYDGMDDLTANETDSQERDHSCNTGNVTADGKYLVGGGRHFWCSWDPRETHYRIL